jgi:GNAT superfamily N-acetyltransferase
MFPLPDKIDLVRAVDNQPVEARIVKLTRTTARTKIDSKWWQDLGASTEIRKNENDNSWHWAKRVGDLKYDRWHERLAVETEDGDIQGAILYWLNARSFVTEEKGAVYVEALATAPRNRPWLVSAPLYRGVGENLLLRATLHSYVVGLEGRLNLLSFRDERTVSFYQRRGFEIVGEDDDLNQMELSPIKALQWLQEEGYDV